VLTPQDRLGLSRERAQRAVPQGEDLLDQRDVGSVEDDPLARCDVRASR
jgi:hypothetical protein